MRHVKCYIKKECGMRRTLRHREDILLRLRMSLRVGGVII
jgi:hypothetical protein